MLRTDVPRTDQSQKLTGGAVAVPSCAKSPDQKLIVSAVSHIRSLLAKTVARGMDEIGRYLLRHFYEDNPKLYFSASSRKHMSLRQLMERCESMELPISRTFLARSLAMAVITRQLPRTAAFHKLSTTHRLALLRLKEPAIVEFIASKALSEKLTVRKLRNLVDEQLQNKGTHPVRGRRRKPLLLRSIDSCLQNLWDDQAKKPLVTRSEIRGMTASDRARAESGLVELQSCLAELRGMIK